MTVREAVFSSWRQPLLGLLFLILAAWMTAAVAASCTYNLPPKLSSLSNASRPHPIAVTDPLLPICPRTCTVRATARSS